MRTLRDSLRSGMASEAVRRPLRLLLLGNCLCKATKTQASQENSEQSAQDKH